MADVHGGETAYTQLAAGTSLTFAEWEADSNRLARGLAAVGVRRGDRVVLHLDNEHLERWLISYAAIHKAGAVAVPTNVRLTAPELTAIAADAEPAAAITSIHLRPTVVEALADAGREVALIEADDEAQWGPLMAGDDRGLGGGRRRRGPRRHHVHLGHHRPGQGGGRPPPQHPHHPQRRASVDRPVVAPLLAAVDLRRHLLRLQPHEDGHARPLPAPLRCGPLDRRRRAERPTCAFLVPAMVQLLVADERLAGADLSSITLLSIGSAPLPPNLHQAMAERLPGATVTNNYSMTEAGTAFTYLPPGEVARRPGSVGMPLPPTEIRIADADGAPVPTGDVGEVLIKVGEHHREYYRDPQATAATWTGPWLRSGDLGRLDADGYLYIVGRAKDVVIRGGNNISATEVEHALYEHDGVLEAAVIGIPHDVLGEDVAAFVVPRPGAHLDADELRRFCAERLADYKVPRAVWFVAELPRNANGKVVKRELVVPDAPPA